MAQAVRLLDKDYDQITSKDITTLKAEDIELPVIKEERTRTIGFIRQ